MAKWALNTPEMTTGHPLLLGKFMTLAECAPQRVEELAKRIVALEPGVDARVGPTSARIPSAGFDAKAQRVRRSAEPNAVLFNAM